MDIINKKIAHIRSCYSFTYKEFAEHLDYSPVTLINVESGKIKPSKKLICKISDEFDISQKYLLDDNIPINNFSLSNEEKREPTFIIAQRLQQLRKEKKMTTDEVAILINCDRSFLTHIELGDYRLSDKMLKALADVYNVSEEYILTGNVLTKDYPLNETILEWLSKKPEIREEIYNKFNTENK